MKELQAYLLALLALGTAVVTRWLLDPLLGDLIPLATLYGAVAFAVWIGGWRPALLTAVLGLLISGYLFISPRGELLRFTPEVAAICGGYTFSCGLIITLGEAMRRARKRAEAAAEEAGASESRFRALFEQTTVGVAQVDTSGRFVLVNDGYCGIVGWSREDLMRMRMQDLTHPEDLPPNIERFTRLAAGSGENFAIEKRYLRPDGATVWVRNTVFGVRDDGGQVRYITAVVTDISEQKEAERALAESEKQLSLITNAVPALISYIDSNLRYQRANRTYERWFGLSEEQIRGKKVREVLGEEAWERVRSPMERALAGEEVRFEEELPYQDGMSRRWVEVTYTPDRDEAGKVRGFAVLVHDISEQKRTQRRLADREHEFRTIFELAGSGKSQVDAETGRFTRVNRRFCEITGYSEPELLAMHFSEITHPEDREVDAERVMGVIRGEAANWISEKRYIRKDGKIVWVLVTGSVIRDADGKPTRTVATVNDITERKRAEEELAKRTEELRLVADAMPALISYVDAQQRYQFVNRGYQEWFGKEPEELRGKHLREVLGDEVFARVRPHVERALAGERVHFEAELPYKYGGARYVHVEYVPHVSGSQVIGFYALVMDVSAAKEAERALAESEQRFRTMADTAPAMLWVCDAEQQCTFMSRGWFEFTGQKEEEALGVGWVRAVHPEDRERAAKTFLEAAVHRQPFAFDYRLRDVHGNYRWAIDAGRPRFGEDGTYLGYIGSVIDVDERKQAEEGLQRAQESLLERAAQLEQLNRELERFVSIASHDLKEPLRGVATLASFIVEDDSGASEETRGRLRRISDLCARLTAMVQGLLEYARSGGERMNVRCELEGAAQSAIDKMAEMIAGEKAEVAVVGHLPVVDGDPVLLERMFANLIANGLRYNEADVKRVEIGCADGTIFVRDNGVGIDPRHHERVFELFKRVARDGEEGTGLGLALVRNIVRSHGGRVWLESELGEGSTFHIRFPASAGGSGIRVRKGTREAEAGV